MHTSESNINWGPSVHVNENVCWAFSVRMLLVLFLTPTMSLCASAGQRQSKYFPEVFESLPSMAGKYVAVTGASRGLGFVTAHSLAKKGAAVALLCRPSVTADEARDAVAAVATGPEPMIVDCDHLDFESVRAAAGRLREEWASSGLDVLCLNAGVMLQPDAPSKDGYDITISTNVLSHFLLTRELMPALQLGASLRGEARIVSMSSGSGFGPPAFDERFYQRAGGHLGGQRASYERYHQSKLANLLFTVSLHERLKARGLRIKALA